ncbi:Smr/MutS family protein [bacterium]|nr:Smr/MutS family protein [bacterium]
MVSPAANTHEFEPGDWIEVRGMGGVARVIEIDKRRRSARVEFNKQEWIVKLNRLAPAEAPEPPRKKPVQPVINAAPTYHEIDLHGARVEDALEMAEKAIDQAVVGHLDKVKLIHGHGTGAVRKAIREMLARNPHVESYRFGSPMEGGLACTIAELKRP